MSGEQIDLGSYTFNGDPMPQCPNQRWRAVTPIDGWWSADARVSTQPRPRRDGLVTDEAYTDRRALTLIGAVQYARSTDSEEDVLLDLEDAFDIINDAVDLVVYESTPKQISVRRNGRADLAPVTPRTIEFRVPLLAADPRKYAVATTTTAIPASGTGPVTGGGTTSSYPTIEITAPGGGISAPWSITNDADPGKAIGFTRALAAGETLDIDMETMEVTLNGGDGFQYLQAGWEPWQIFPGAQTVTASVAFAFDVVHRDAWK